MPSVSPTNKDFPRIPLLANSNLVSLSLNATNICTVLHICNIQYIGTKIHELNTVLAACKVLSKYVLRIDVSNMN